MIKFILLGIIVVALIICGIILLMANGDPAEKLDMSDKSLEELEGLKEQLEIKIKTLSNVKEIKKLEKLLADVDTKLDTLNSNS